MLLKICLSDKLNINTQFKMKSDYSVQGFLLALPCSLVYYLDNNKVQLWLRHRIPNVRYSITNSITFYVFSGGHFNPAVTLGATLAGALSPLLAAGYVLAQIFGAILGAAFVRVCIESLPY